MTNLVNPGGAKASAAKAAPDHLELLKATVRQTLSLDEVATVVIQQLACAEPGCPPVETVVAVLGSPRRSWKFAAPTAEVTAAHLHDTLSAYPEGLEHDHRDR